MSVVDLEQIEKALESAEESVYNAHKYIALVEKFKTVGTPEALAKLASAIEDSIKELTIIKQSLDQEAKNAS